MAVCTSCRTPNDMDVHSSLRTVATVQPIFDYSIRVMEMVTIVKSVVMQKYTKYKIRAGVATGQVIQGVLSGKKLSFDVWGDVRTFSSCSFLSRL